MNETQRFLQKGASEGPWAESQVGCHGASLANGEVPAAECRVGRWQTVGLDGPPFQWEMGWGASQNRLGLNTLPAGHRCTRRDTRSLLSLLLGCPQAAHAGHLLGIWAKANFKHSPLSPIIWSCLSWSHAEDDMASGSQRKLEPPILLFCLKGKWHHFSQPTPSHCS